MQLKKLLQKWDLTSLKISTPFMETEWVPRDEDKTAAWELHIELITRVATQHLEPEEGDEGAALASIADLFELTRETIKRNGHYRMNFTRIAVVVLNQKVRPFTAKWHPKVLAGSLGDADKTALRAELRALQTDLRNCTLACGPRQRRGHDGLGIGVSVWPRAPGSAPAADRRVHQAWSAR